MLKKSKKMPTHELSLLLSLSDNVMDSSVVVKRHAGQRGSTAHATPNIFCVFQKQSLLTSLQQSIPTPNKVDVFGTGMTLPGCVDLNQAVT
jgi:hypothetical protein